MLAVDMEELLDLEVSKTLAALEGEATAQAVQEVSKTQAVLLMVDTMEDLPPVNVPVSVPQSSFEIYSADTTKPGLLTLSDILGLSARDADTEDKDSEADTEEENVEKDSSNSAVNFGK